MDAGVAGDWEDNEHEVSSRSFCHNAGAIVHPIGAYSRAAYQTRDSRTQWGKELYSRTKFTLAKKKGKPRIPQRT